MSFLQKLEHARGEVVVRRHADPWHARLEKLRGEVGCDGVERITTQRVMYILEVHQRARRSGAYRRLAKLMARTRLECGAGKRDHERGLFRAGSGVRALPCAQVMAWMSSVG
jgi:hypothetical protein